MSQNIERVFVKPDDTATICCPECQLAKTVTVGKFRSTRHTMTARCTCGHSFSVSLDFRKHYRKQTTLPGIYETQGQGSELDDSHWKETKLTGVYTMQSPATGGGHVLISNLSCGGLQFITTGHHHIEVGQRARISFTLDDQKRSEITKHVIIQSVTDKIVGCRFAKNEPLEQGLRFYLFP